MWTGNWREQIWTDLDQPWDLIVIGGGITGAGILREASRANLKTLLVEGHDFASGTSSRSSKMVHGGLRYLRNAQVRLTVDSVHERERLLREGRGLIEPLSFLIAGYLGDRPPAWIFGLGLMVYDVLGRTWAHHHYDAPQLQDLCPYLTGTDLIGGYQYSRRADRRRAPGAARHPRSRARRRHRAQLCARGRAAARSDGPGARRATA